MKRLVVAGLMVAAFAVGLSLEPFAYGSAGTSAGIVLRVREVPACVGLEYRGAPGMWAGIYEGCDF